MSTILDRLSDPGIIPYWYLYIEEADHYFTSVDLGLPHADQTVCLDPQNLRIEDSVLDRKAGVASTKTMTVKLGPQQAERLTTLLSSTQNGEPGVYLAGRLAYLCMGLMDSSGRMLDTAGTVFEPDVTDPPDYQMVIFAGPIEAIQPNSDWLSWSVTIQSLEALLDTRMGYDSVDGTLLPIIPYDSMRTGWWSIPTYDGANQVTWDISVVFGGASYYRKFTETFGDNTDRIEIMARIESITNSWIRTQAFYTSECVDAVFNYLSDPDWIDGDWNGDDPSSYRHKMTFWWDANGASAPDFQPRMTLYVSEPSSLLPAMGFVSDQTITLWYVEAKAAESFVAEQPPAIVFLGQAQRRIVVYLENEPPAAGFCRIQNQEGKVEVFRYDSFVEVDFYNKTAYQLNALDTNFTSLRGRFGTDPIVVNIPASLTFDSKDNGWKVTETATVAVKIMSGLEEANLFDLFGVLVTNESGAGPWYTASLPSGYCGNVPDWLVDDETLSALGDSELVTAKLQTRAYLWGDSQQLNDLLSRELAALGYTLQSRWRTSDRTYRLCFDQVRLPLFIAGTEVTSADCVHNQPIEIMTQSSACINHAVVTIRPPSQLGGADVQYQFKWADSIARLRKAQTQEYEIGGIVDAAKLQADQIAAHMLSLLASYAYPYELVTMPLRRAFWKLRPGQQVSVTLPGAPKPGGGRGWLAEPMIVLGVTRNYLPGPGEPPCVVTMLHTLGVKQSYWSPSARVDSYTAGTLTITFDANEFSQPGPWLLNETLAETDLRWFSQAAYVRLIQQNTDSSAVEMQVSSVDPVAGTIVLSGAPATAPVAGDWITFPTWDNRTAFELAFVAIADNAQTLGTAGDPAFQYV